MKHVRTAVIAVASLSALGGAPAASAQSVETAGATTCAISGWSNDSDPAGLNVHAAPNKDARVIGRLPPPRAQAGDTYSAEFDIIGSRNGWLLIRNAHFADYGDGKGDRVVFAGPGWVFADKVRFLINSVDLRGAANAHAPVVAKLSARDGASGPDSANIDHVYGCAGHFAEVAVHMERQSPIRGWATGICNNQVTTCP
jgi:hypothetical protein